MQLSIRLSPLVSLYEYDGARSSPPATSERAIALPQIQSLAFGDGKHPTTRLCAGVVDYFCRTKVPRAVLDVGTGTGVLARIARARGAQMIVATDIDPQALSAAKANIALDEHLIQIALSNQMPDSWGPRFDLVIANILEGPLRSLALSLAAALIPEGTLLLSGFTPLQIPALEVAFQQCGLTLETQSTLEGWALLAFKKANPN